MTKKIKVGTTIPGIVLESNIMMELESEVKDDDDIHQATDQTKQLLAELISGGDPERYLVVLANLNYPNNRSFVFNRQGVLEKYQEEIQLLQVEIAKAKLKAKRLLEYLEKYQLMDRLQAILKQYPTHNEAFRAIVRDVMPTLNEDNTDNV